MNRTEMLLVQLAEECAEVQQQCCKALRFGLDDVYLPESTETNAESIQRELEDLTGIVKMLQTERIIEHLNHDNFEKKRIKVEKFMEYSEKRGILT